MESHERVRRRRAQRRPQPLDDREFPQFPHIHACSVVAHWRLTPPGYLPPLLSHLRRQHPTSNLQHRPALAALHPATPRDHARTCASPSSPTSTAISPPSRPSCATPNSTAPPTLSGAPAISSATAPNRQKSSRRSARASSL